MANNVVSMDKKAKAANTSEKVEGFVTRNRVVILCVVAALVVCAIVVGVVFGLKDSSVKKSLASINEIEYTYTDNSVDLSDAELSARQTLALDSLASYTSKSGIVGVRANFLAGSVAFDAGKFAESAAYYEKAASLQKKTYMVPLCSYNAAASYEELGNLEKAEELYLAATNEFDFAAHAYLSLGRVREARGNYQGAVEAYKSISSDEEWYKLAQDRIIALAVEGKAE